MSVRTRNRWRRILLLWLRTTLQLSVLQFPFLRLLPLPLVPLMSSWIELLIILRRYRTTHLLLRKSLLLTLMLCGHSRSNKRHRLIPLLLRRRTLSSATQQTT